MERFVLSDEEMQYLGYLMEPTDHHHAMDSELCDKDIDDLKTKSFDVWFLDCEMIETTVGTEVAIIGFGRYDSTTDKTISHILKIKPKGEIVDYITHITGIDKNTDLNLTMQQGIDELLKHIKKNDIIVGHHLYIDLKALNFYHSRVIDCCMIFHHPDGPPYYYSLKDLAASHLKRQIQIGTHDPVEDGVASYDLVKWCVDEGYIKSVWQNIGKIFIPSINHVVQALRIQESSIVCLYTRGSRAIGTNKPDSDYDLVAVCDIKTVINGTLTRYGNIDICCYDVKYFEQMLRDQIIWAVECIYCPTDLIYVEKTDYRVFYEQYRINHTLRANEMLRQSVGYETARKMASAKKHYQHGDVHHAKKHAFIGIRFVEYARQIVHENKIKNIRGANYIWDMLKASDSSLCYNDFKSLWRDLYVRIYQEFSTQVPKKQKYSQEKDNDSDSQLCAYAKIRDIVGNQGEGALQTIDKLICMIDDPTHLKSHHQINVYESKKSPDLVLLRYNNQTPDGLIKYVSRGLILDKKTKRVVSYPFNNFVDMPGTLDIDKSDILHIFEKIDGSFASLYHYDGSWCLSTSRNPDGDSVIGIRKNQRIVFDELFWKTFKAKGYDETSLNPRYNYMFELVSKDHQIIVQYEADDLVLIGVRDMGIDDNGVNNYFELDIMDHRFDQFTRPKIYHDLSCVADMDPDTHEGCVIVTKDFYRFKVKKPEYVKKALMFPLCIRNKNINLQSHVLKVVQEGEEKEFIKYCPEYLKVITDVKSVYESFITNTIKLYDDVVTRCKTRKDFATFILVHPRIYHKYLFALYDKIDLHGFLSGIKTKRLYSDLFITKNLTHRIVNDYGYTSENKHGKYAHEVEEWEKQQITLAQQIVETDKFNIDSIKYVGGLDISFDTQDDTIGVAYITIYCIKEKKIVHEDWIKCTLHIPYISGYLGFREVPEYVKLLDKVKSEKPHFFPDVLMMDGFGILHHRGFGSASHIGHTTQIPTIGVAKTLLHVDGLEEYEVKQRFKQQCVNPGDWIELRGQTGRLYGVGYKSTKDTTNPIYISVGHNISLESCIKIVSLITKYKIPEPIRNSDIKSKLFLK